VLQKGADWRTDTEHSNHAQPTVMTAVGAGSRDPGGIELRKSAEKKFIPFEFDIATTNHNRTSPGPIFHVSHIPSCGDKPAND